MPSARKLILIGVALALAALFARLGLWQLERHAERSAASAARTERSALPVLEWREAGAVPADTGGTVGRRVRLTGSWVREHEVILRSRPSEGRAGVELLTPLLVAGEGPAVMVLRGWLPAPDGLNADLTAGWPEGEAAQREVEGTLIAARDARAGRPLAVTVDGREHLALGGIDLATLRERLPLDISPHVVRADDPPLGAPIGPARAIQIGSGPHLAYAIQWFAFAVISLVGTGLLLRKERGR